VSTPIDLKPNFGAEQSFLAARETRSWLSSLDNRRIALTYLATITLVFAIGLAFAVRLGLERLDPRSLLMKGGTYGRALAVHGVVMVFLVVVPAIPTTLGSFVLPRMLGAQNLAFPRLNRAGLWLFWAGAALVLLGVSASGLRSAWTFTEAYDGAATGSGVLVVMTGALLVAASGLLGGLNAIVTIHKLRAPGLTWSRLPVLGWAAYGASVIAVLAPASLALALMLAAAERTLHIGIFDPALGGDPIFFQHLFWFYAHPMLFGTVLWALGIASEILGAHARRPVFGHALIGPLMLVLALLSFTQWGIHLVGGGVSGTAASVFSLASLLSSGLMVVVIGNWLATLRGGSIALTAPMLFALSLVLNLAVWLASSAALAVLGLGAYLRGTPFEVAHVHYGLVGVTLTAFLGGLFHWWPKLTGRAYDERAARVVAIGLVVGLNVTFLGQFVAGLAGTAHRHAHLGSLQPLDLLNAVGSCILAGALVLAARTLIVSLLSGPNATPNPWGAASLEWQIESPPPAKSFEA
jgi:cytochrome c oxidase subunit 1